MIGLRLSNDLLRKVKAAAKEEHRKLGPMVAEIVRRYFSAQEQPCEPETVLSARVNSRRKTAAG